MAHNPAAHHKVEGFMLPSYGRRKGRPLRDSQQRLMEELLPSIEVNATAEGQLTGWPQTTGDVWLEIGFGGGEHMLGRAKANPDVTMVGCEVFQQSFAIALASIARDDVRNIRLCQNDARHLLAAMPDACIRRAFILFPDPWPRKRNHKRRIVNQDTLTMLARVMTPGAELLLATDIPDYAGWMAEHVTAHPDFVWQVVTVPDIYHEPEGWVRTRYQQKAEREGRRGMFLRVIRL